MSNDPGQLLINSLNNGLFQVVNFVPKFVAGLVILLIGIIVSSILKQVVLEILKVLKVESFLRRYGVPEAKEELTWTNILAEIIRWFVIIMFLIPTADVWGLPQIVTVLNTFLLFLPNVFVAAIIILVGFVFARLAHDVVLGSTRGFDLETSRTIASITKWSIIIFALLAALTQLGIASDLLKTLYTGIVAMLAVAGGIAFGLGGQDSAKDLLENFRKRTKTK